MERASATEDSPPQTVEKLEARLTATLEANNTPGLIDAFATTTNERPSRTTAPMAEIAFTAGLSNETKETRFLN
ncbi:MAG: hypothetical protein VX453_02365 [Acidobacteriota bacterium]|nr:hypothetical protein [Acidobacteriota bacterium]